MFNYFKWEMLSEIRKLKIILITLFVTFFMIAISDLESSLSQIFVGLFGIEMYILIFGALYYGGKRTIDTYSKKTFLLESMIPISAKKLLLVKYIISIIMSFASCLLLFIGIAIIGEKVNVNILEFFKELIKIPNMNDLLFKAFILFTSISVFVTSLMTASFVLLKSLFPSLKKAKGLSYLLTYIIAYIFVQLLGNAITSGVYTASLILIAGSVCCYFITVLLVENKLEVYS